ncbi:MAG: hypothetical protein ACE5IP_01105 [Terriglobia bacterium]
MNQSLEHLKELLTDPRFQVALGMSIAYVASFLGMLLAYLSYRKRRRLPSPSAEGKDKQT